MAGSAKSDQYRGWLYKWTNYIKGYQKRWFVLQNGQLSYYRFVFITKIYGVFTVLMFDCM